MKLIIHIGAGKTGSTSIQKTLLINDEILKNNGIWYLGLMLERANKKLFDWQKNLVHIIQDFNQKKEEEITSQIVEILKEIIKEAKSKNIEKLIWSNESFLVSNHNFLPALNILKKEIGLEVEFIVYVRGYISWMQSAYLQWGIKHKTYKGELRSFNEWSINFHKPFFFKQINGLLHKIEDFPIYIRNMSASKSIINDFCEVLDIDSSRLNEIRDNDALKGEELFFRTLFNSNYKEEVLPNIFEESFKNIDFSKTPKEFLEEYLPKKSDLEKVLEDTNQDREELNFLLSSQNQPIVEENIKKKELKIDSEKLLLSISQIVINQSKEIEKLKKEIEALKK